MNHIIRECTKDDLPALANVVAISWNETYKGLVPNDELEKMKAKNDQEERLKRFIKQFEEKKFHQLVLEVNGKIVGFIRYEKSMDPEFNNCGEIYALYIIKKYHGYGFGRELFEIARDDLKRQGFDKMIIACLKGNPTNNFYQHMGGKYVKDGVFKRLNLEENIYYYKI